MKKKLLALFLCCALSFGLVTAALITPAAAESDFMVYHESAPVTTVQLAENGSVTVQGLLEQNAAGTFQWQIMARGVWANIVGSASNTLTLRYAMVANLLNGDGQVSIRCRFTPVDGEAMYSNIVTVQMTSGDVATTIPVDDVKFDFTVTDPGSVVEHETAAPTPAEEPTPAPTEEPAPAGNMVVLANETIPDEEPQTKGDETVPADDTPANGTPDVKQTYNVVINYIFANNDVVSEPYTATLAEGSPFSVSVTFPTVLGYLPYVEEVRQDSIDLNIPEIKENVTINVVYKPTDVDYTVIHYQQNIDNDEYTEVERETKQGLTGSQVPEVAKDYMGFYSLIYERPNIAADGSTVIEIHYDRYYYLMLFDMDGGYGTDPIYVRYGAQLGTVNDPTKAGYNFGGWALTKDGTKVDLPATMPAENRTYYALWTPDATAKVTVVFWGENADDEEYSYLADKTKVINLKPGTEFTYSESGMLACALEVHTHSDSCLGCGKVEHTHSAVGGECYTLTCGENPHKHDASCYSGAGDEASPLIPPRDPVNGQVYKRAGFNFIYINGQWYDYSGSLSNGSVAQPSCGKQESSHTHKDSCYKLTCTTEEHTHVAGCYTCGKTEHTHNSNCYLQGAGLDSKLWKFVRSDTITVAADGSSVVNVYYDREEYSVQFYKNKNCSANQEYTNLKITAKWDQKIFDRWPEYDNSKSWYVQGKSDTWQNSIQVMPVGGAKFWGPKTGSASSIASYYVEALPGASDTVDYNGTAYIFHHADKSSSSGNVTDEDKYDIQGFTYVGGTRNGASYDGAKFYYSRNSYKLAFNNQEDNVKEELVKYEAPLGDYAGFVPEPPSWYEPNSVEFAGWYLNPQCTGEQYDLTKHTMPSNDLILYAKWVPVTHTVKFYLTEDSTEVYKPSNDKEATFTVEHGGNIAKAYVDAHLTKDAMLNAKPNGDYKFVVWYYNENGVRKYFDPTMQVRTDLTLYAEWSSDSLKPYTVQYVLKNDHSVKVADDLTGSGLAGTTKTFNAKGGTELYVTYQEGYFPVVQSQSLVLDINADSLVITFEYVQAPAVPYVVNYLTAENPNDGNTYETITIDGTLYYKLAASKAVNDNHKAVVTEKFEPVSGYMPDAYQKRLVVSVDENGHPNAEKNVINFIYTKDTQHAYYKITHHTQNTDGQTWTVYAESQAVGDIGTTYNAEAMNIPGFTYDPNIEGTLVSGELTAEGLELKLYYVRNQYPYQVRYLEQGTGNVLHDPKNGTGLYGKMVSEDAIDIDGYDKVDPTTVSISIRIETDKTAKLNVITFYYTEKTVEIKYVPVGPADAANFGSVAPASETVKVKNGTAVGSTPTPGTGFKFVGWYTDAECKKPVEGNGWIVGTVIKPQKGEDGKNTAATYYAKFEYDVANLIIHKTGCEAADTNQSFIFTVTGPDGYYQKVVIKGNDSVTLKGLTVGTYTITEDTGWSWRYKPAENPMRCPLVPGVDNSVTFSNSRENTKWLDGDVYSDNVFTKSVSGN